MAFDGQAHFLTYSFLHIKLGCHDQASGGHIGCTLECAAPGRTLGDGRLGVTRGWGSLKGDLMGLTVGCVFFPEGLFRACCPQGWRCEPQCISELLAQLLTLGQCHSHGHIRAQRAQGPLGPQLPGDANHLLPFHLNIFRTQK